MNEQKESKRATKRWQNLMPDERPRYVRIYDGGPDNKDRYTAVFTGRRGNGLLLLMSADPYDKYDGILARAQGPNNTPVDTNDWGFAPPIGRTPAGGANNTRTVYINNRPQQLRLGVHVDFWDLPKDCREAVIREYCAVWGLELPGGIDEREGAVQGVEHEREVVAPIDLRVPRYSEEFLPPLDGELANSVRREVIVLARQDGEMAPTPAYEEMFTWPEADGTAHVALATAVNLALDRLFNEHKGLEIDRIIDTGEIVPLLADSTEVRATLERLGREQPGHTFNWRNLGADLAGVFAGAGYAWGGGPRYQARDKLLDFWAKEELILDAPPELPSRKTCGSCGADLGPSDSYPWHNENEDCRAVKDPDGAPINTGPGYGEDRNIENLGPQGYGFAGGPEPIDDDSEGAKFWGQDGMGAARDEERDALEHLADKHPDGPCGDLTCPLCITTDETDILIDPDLLAASEDD
jgi:hypothetical protein